MTRPPSDFASTLSKTMIEGQQVVLAKHDLAAESAAVRIAAAAKTSVQQAATAAASQAAADVADRFESATHMVETACGLQTKTAHATTWTAAGFALLAVIAAIIAMVH